MTHDAWKCATLPFKYGGLGLTKALVIVEAGYVASIFTSWSLLCQLCAGWLDTATYSQQLNKEFGSPCATMVTRFSLPNDYTFQSLTIRARSHGFISDLQDEVADIIKGKLADEYMLSSNYASEAARLKRARFLSSASAEAVRVFATVPTPATKTETIPELWRTMIDLHLGNPVFNGQYGCPECARSRRNNVNLLSSDPLTGQDSSQGSTETDIKLDKHGYHASTWRKATGSTSRHNRIRNFINVWLRHPAIGLIPVIEWTFPGQEQLPWKHRGRLDLVIDDVAFNGERQEYDVTIVSQHDKQYTKEYALPARMDIDIHSDVGVYARRAFRQMALYAAEQKGSYPAVEYGKLTLRVVTRALQLTAAAINSRRRQLAMSRMSSSCDCSC